MSEKKNKRNEVNYMNLSASFSTGKAAYRHDIKDRTKKNIDQSLSKDNVILKDVLQGKSIERYTDELMQPVIDKYNEKQQKESRKIKVPYTEWHKSNKTLQKTQLVYEAVAQIGEHESLGKMYYEAEGEKREKLHRYFEEQYKKVLKDFERNYPHLKVMWAAIHFDEPAGTPHLHMAFQPIGSFEKQGLSYKVSIGRALEQDGIERVKDRKEAQRLGGYQLTKLYHQVRKEMEQELIRQGHTIKEPVKGKKHTTLEEWEAIKELEKERAKKEAEAYITYEQELKDISEAANRPREDPSKVQRVQVKDGTFKKKEVIQMDEQTFESYKASADVKAIERRVESKIKEQEKAAQKLIQGLTTEKEEALQNQVQDLQQQLQQAKNEIKEKEKLIKKMKEKMEMVKEFMQSLNILQRFKNWYEQKQIERNDFYFEGRVKE